MKILCQRTYRLSLFALVLCCFQAIPAGAQVVATPAAEQVPDGRSSPNGARRTLDLAALEALAKENNPTLVQARAHVQANEAKALQAGRYPNPRVGYVAEQIGVAGTAGELHGAFVEQEIVTGGKLRLSREKYKLRARAAELISDAQQRKVINDVRLHFYRALAKKEIVGIHGSLLRNAEDNLVTVQEMVNVGQSNQSDVHLAKASLERARLDLLMAENDYRSSLSDLAAGVGAELREAEPTGQLDGPLTVIDFEEALARLLGQHPGIAASRLEIEADEITVQRERREVIPNLIVGVGVGWNFETREAVYSAQFSVRIPFFNRNQGTVRQASADLERQRAEVRRQELQLRRKLAKRYRDYVTALQHVRDYQQVVLPEARRAYQLRLKAYRENRQDWPRVLAAQNYYYRERLGYTQHLLEWREGEVAINGLLLVGGLEPVEGPMPRGHIDAVAKPR